MAVRIITKVWDGYPGGGSELLVLLALADWSDDDGKCWPSITSIGKKTRLSPDQARRVTHRLIGAGFLQVVSGKDGGHSSRRYQIQLDKLTPCMDATPSAHARGGMDATPPLASVQAHPLHSYASRTVIEPSLTVNDSDLPSQVASKAADHQCPHQEIIDLYHSILPTGRRVKIWSEARKTKLRARWREDAKRQNLDWWKRLFAYVARSEFLTGKVSTKDRKPFELDLEWIITPANLVKIIEGKYHEEPAA